MTKYEEVIELLEFDKEQYSTNIKDLKDFIASVFVIISDLYAKVTPTSIKERKNVYRLKMSDEEIITIATVGELMGIDSETAWYNFCIRNLSDLFPAFCDRTRFNRIRRNLQSVINEIRKEINRMVQPSEIQIIDSLPLPVCKFGRAAFHKTFRRYGASFGRCPSKKETYLGYKLHLLCNSDGYPYDFLITPANIDDRVPVIELLESQNQLMEYLLADKGYTGVDFRRNVEEKIGIAIYPLPKKGDCQPECEKSLRQLIFKKRRRIETTGSQLTDQLNLQRVRAKSLWGLITRLFSKFLAFDVAYLINVLNGNNHPIKIKSLIF
jgi:hypothetical protein